MFDRTEFVLFSALVIACCIGCTAVDDDDHPTLGIQAPVFTATMLDGSTFELSEYLGRDVVILDFWATWCGPCVRSLPTVSEVAADYRDRGVRFFAVDIGETPDAVRQFLESTSLDLRVVMDVDGSISELYRAEAIPHTVIIGSDGKVSFAHVGASPNLRAELTGELDRLVAAR